MSKCKHKDCMYRMREELSHGSGPCCDYLSVTGRLRLQVIAANVGKSTKEIISSGLLAADKCPLYCKGKRSRKAEFPCAQSRLRLNSEDDTRRMELYARGFNDHQIANALGMNPSTIYEWRKQRGLKANHVKKPERKEVVSHGKT